MKKGLLSAWLVLLVILTTQAQPWVYDFGTGTGTANNSNAATGNTSIFSSTPSGGGTYRTRIGGAGGSLVLANPGTSLGSGTEAQLTAATSTATNKMGIYDWTSPSTVAYLKCKIRTTSTGNGNLNISFGINTIASDNQGFTSHYNNSLASLRINYSSGAIGSVQRRTSGADNTISSSGITKDADQVIEVYLNNGSSSTSYTVSGTSYTLNAQQWDLWIAGTKVSPANGWAKAGTLSSGTNLSGFAFYAESSTSNAAVFYIDDIEYSNALPTTSPVITASPTSLTLFNYVDGSGPSSAQSTSLTASNLSPSSGNLTVTASTNYEVSANNSTWTSTSFTIPYTGGALASTPIYVRLKAGLGVGNYNGENVQVSGGGATTVNVSCSGSVSAIVTEGLQISTANQAYAIDFDNTVSLVNAGQFNAQANVAVASPSTGQLNNTAWGFSSTSSTGSNTFGTTITGGLGASDGNVTSAGIYAFQVSSGNYAIGIQPTGSYWNGGGNITLKVQNKTGSNITSLLIAYTVYVRNDQARGNTFNFSVSSDNSSYSNQTSLDFTSKAVADGSPQWKAQRRVILLPSVSITNNNFYYLRWYGADATGSGTRDEFALDDITVVGNPSNYKTVLSGTNESGIVNGDAELTANTSFDSLVIGSASSLTIGSNTLTLNGAISGSGTLTGSATSDLTIGGNVGTITFTSGGRTIRNLQIGNGSNASMVLGSNLDIAPTGSITFNASGTKSLTTTGRILTLKSTAAGTAVIGNLNGATITGNITAERFVSSVARRWRFLGSTFSNATFEDWRNDIFITGAGSGTTPGALNSNGFDATLSNQPSVYSYNEAATGTLNNGWVALTNSTSSLSNQPIVAGKGYRVFVRGDRSDVLRLSSLTTQNAVTLNLTGIINSGDFSFPITYTSTGSQANDGWNLVSNPYPCAYDWNAYRDDGTNLSNVDSTIWILDATTGSYKTFNANSSGTLTGGIIPAGASFWIKANGSNPTMVFKEQYKVTTPPVALFKVQEELLQLQLTLDSITKDDWILFHDAESAAASDAKDIRKLPGSINIESASPDGFRLALDARPVIATNDTISLCVSGGTATYTLALTALPSNGKFYYLRDLKTNAMFTLQESFTYTYSTFAEDSSTFGKRFQLIVSGSQSLPVDFVSFDARAEQKAALLTWNTVNEKNNAGFEVQHSTDLQRWNAIGTVAPSGKTSATYRFRHADPNPAVTQYYRIRQYDVDAREHFSSTRSVTFAAQEVPYLLTPNPASTRVTIAAPASQSITVELKDIMGKTVLRSTSPQLDISTLSNGLYMAVITDAAGVQTSLKLVKE